MMMRTESKSWPDIQPDSDREGWQKEVVPKGLARPALSNDPIQVGCLQKDEKSNRVTMCGMNFLSTELLTNAVPRLRPVIMKSSSFGKSVVERERQKGKITESKMSLSSTGDRGKNVR